MRYPSLTIASSHTLASCPSRRPDPGEILLWRLRGEWQLLSSEQGHLCLSKSELRRARTHPNRAHGRRFAISRSALRMILGTLAGRAADALTLIERDASHLAIADCDLLDGLDVVVGHAGIWIVIAIAAGPLGLGIAQTGTLADPAFRDRLRLDSLSNACGAGHGATPASLAPAAGPFRAVETPHAGNWHLLDIPLSGAACAATIAARQIDRIHAVGWRGERDHWLADRDRHLQATAARGASACVTTG
ncbi:MULTISPECIES: hypothetical protein [Burkholderia]|uniref:Uncharacterized protein n=1 Tax=Burkholderia paludis TaxID=1506587 RepID=A0A6P2SKY6_9BURK|nr:MULTISPECIES: hypothetical protein [Burkholderia]CAB3767504.1 hypothetical protein LMG30113_05497 [Burkholderia paludis]VWC45687.1 hypothetical protein BPA30113_07281 [Burkholderia paludis]